MGADRYEMETKGPSGRETDRKDTVQGALKGMEKKVSSDCENCKHIVPRWPLPPASQISLTTALCPLSPRALWDPS